MGQYGLHTAETRLLLACCAGDKIGDEAGGIDWGEFVQRAQDSALAPAVYRHLEHASWLPAGSRDALRRSYLASAASNLRQMTRLSEVLGVLEGRSIPVMLLKGAALLTLVFRDAALHPMGDVDLLVRKEDLPAAVETLYARGLSPAPVYLGKERWFAERHHHWVPLLTPDGGLALELHHSLRTQGPTPPRTEDLWRRARTVVIGKMTARVPATTDLLLHLTIHVSAEAFPRSLGSLFDIGETVRRLGSEIDWSQFIETADEWNAARGAYLCLFLTRHMLHPGIPDEAIERLGDLAGFSRMEKRILPRLAQNLASHPPISRTSLFWQSVIWHCMLCPGLQGKTAWLVGAARGG